MKWIEFVKDLHKKHPDKKLKDILKMASGLWKKKKAEEGGNPHNSTKKSNKKRFSRRRSKSHKNRR